MAKDTKSLKMSEKDVSLKQPEAFKTLPVEDEPTPSAAPPDIVEPPVVVEPIPPPPAPTPPAPTPVSGTKKYRCKVKCWISHRALLCNPGDIVEFSDGEFVPSQFELIE